MKNKEYKIWGIPLFNKVTVFFILVCFYYIVNVATSVANIGMSGHLLAEHNPLNRLMTGLIIAYCLFFSYFTRKRINDGVYKMALLFMIYVIVRYLFSLTEDLDHALYAVNNAFGIIYWISVLLFATKCFSFISQSALNKLIMILVCVVFIFVIYRLITQKIILSYEEIIAGINVAGSTYMLAPLILFVFKGKYRMIMLLVCLFICLYSAKRQAVLGILIVLLLSSKDIIVSYFRQFKLWGVCIILAAILLGGHKYMDSVVSDLINRQDYIESNELSQDSGRADLRNAALKGYKQADGITQIFGGGVAVSSLYIKNNLGQYNAPHCGFVEVLCDYGIIGEIMFISFFFYLLKWSRNFDRFSKWQLLYFSVVMIWIFFNIVSHVVNNFAIYLSITFGYLYNTRMKYQNIVGYK